MSPTPTSPVRRWRYSAAQGARVAWYAAQGALVRQRVGARPTSDELEPTPDRAPADRDAVRQAFRKLFADDLARIEAGLYPPPRDLDPRRLGSAVTKAMAMLADLDSVAARRARRDGVEVRRQADRSLYPAYYLQNFHYQTGGWLTSQSAALYDAQVEVLFGGAADAMRRAALGAVAGELRGRDPRTLSLVDVACGTGRFLEQTLEAFPRLRVTGIDLSPAYVETARERLTPWPTATVETGQAEALRLPSASIDVAVVIYLFHELPPRVRPQVAQELARILKPGGLLVFADSLQPGDAPSLDRLLEAFPKQFHEPFYESYGREDLDALFASAGLIREGEPDLAFLTKVLRLRKPGDAPHGLDES